MLPTSAKKTSGIKIVETALICPKCQSSNFKKGGFNNSGKQQYICKECKRIFVKHPETISAKNYLPQGITAEEMFEYDIWDVRVLGLKPIPSTGGYTLNFLSIEPFWLKNAAKQWIKYKLNNEQTGTLQRKLESIRGFSEFVKFRYSLLKAQDINRELVQNYLVYGLKKSSASTRIHRIIFVKQFLEDCLRFNWLEITKEQLIYPEDLPKLNESLPKFIPDSVLKQLDENLNALPGPVACMVKVLRETGMRISELLELKLNCIRQDSQGGFWIDYYQIKMKKTIANCISRELAIVITNQQQYIKENFGLDFPYLFCQTSHHSWFDGYSNSKNRSIPRELRHFQPVQQKMRQSTIRGYLYQLASDRNIKDASGNIFPLERCHQFRHTHGTELINNGVPQHIVQKRLGHKSADMTSVYAHIHDQTMKREMEKFWDGRVVNVNGEVITSENPDLDTAEMQWIKKNMKAQALANGFCGLPVRMDCPVQGSPCLTCSHFRTTVEHLEIHKKQLENTEKIIENAQTQGWTRQLEINEPIAENLRNIIWGLEGGSAHV